MNSSMHKKNLPVANISNQLAFNLSWNLTFREWNVVLYLISKLDSKNQKSFEEQVVSIKELESALKTDNKKWGGIYHEVNKIGKSLMSKPINFYTHVMIDGKPLMGNIAFFELIMPEHGENGTVNLRFKFTGSVKPLLLELTKRFVSIPQHKTKRLKNGHAIRFLIAAKAKRDMARKYESISSLKYTLDDFRVFLGIPGKYPDFRNFRRAVINRIRDEINKNCDFLEVVDIKYDPEKGKPKKGVEFLIADRDGGNGYQLSFLPNQDWQPSPEEVKTLCRSKLYAYQILVEFGVTPGIAFRQMLPQVQGTEFIGFEDWYIEEVIRVFNKKTRIPKKDVKARAGAFVNWFLGTSFKEDQFSEILERVHARKKILRNNEPESWDNRMIAKDMTDNEFEIFYREQKQTRKRKENTSTETSGFHSVKEILSK